MNDHDEDRLDDALRDAVTGYNEPPVAPRDEMWAAIQQRRAELRHETSLAKADRPALRFRQPRPVLRWAAGIAAVLVLGIGIGRFTAGGGDAAPATAASPVPAPASSIGGGVALELAANRHLEQAETFLTLFRAATASGRSTDLAAETARELLLSNRLLLDSRVSEKPHMQLLLQDLELVLAQIAQLPAEGSRGDAELITEGMDAGSMLPRLRLVMSDGASATLRQGAL